MPCRPQFCIENCGSASRWGEGVDGYDGRMDSVVVCSHGPSRTPVPTRKKWYSMGETVFPVGEHFICSRVSTAYTKTNTQPVILSRKRILGKWYTKRSKDLSAKRNFCCYGGEIGDPLKQVFRLRRGSFGCFFTHTNTLLLLRMTSWEAPCLPSASKPVGT